MREESFLKLIGEQIGQVISIDSSEAYRSKLFGPRIRLLVRELHCLPQTVVIPRLDGEGTVEYNQEYSGLPNQCGRCRGHDHLAWNCPKKLPPVRNKETLVRNKGEERRGEMAKGLELRESLVNRGATPADLPQSHATEQTISLEVSSDSPAAYAGVQEELHVQETENKIPVNQEGARDDGQRPVSPSTETTRTPSLKDKAAAEQEEIKIDPLQPNDINFPKLSSPTPVKRQLTPRQEPEVPNVSKEPHFVWKSQHVAMPGPKAHMAEGGKSKDKPLDSTPLTRQGYRTGRLAEDFWSALGMPNTPATNHKMLRVIPFLTKNRHLDKAEYLADRRGHSFGAIAHVQISEIFAGIPWTQSRARQHVVDKVSQVLHKILIFNNNLSNPFQKWAQGSWYAQWGPGAEGEYICTLYVSIDVPEQKVKPRKSHSMSWRKKPEEVSIARMLPVTEDIQPIATDLTTWQTMAGRLPGKKANEQTPPESHNRFATLLEDEANSDR